MKITLTLNFNMTIIKYEQENTFIRKIPNTWLKTKKLNSWSRAVWEAVINLSQLLWKQWIHYSVQNTPPLDPIFSSHTFPQDSL
jgi:hypothetical protein